MINMTVLEKTIIEVFDEIKKEIPSLNNISFEISEWYKGRVHGFYHIGAGCQQYDNIEDLAILLSGRKKARSEKEILFRKFS